MATPLRCCVLLLSSLAYYVLALVGISLWLLVAALAVIMSLGFVWYYFWIILFGYLYEIPIALGLAGTPCSD